MIRICIWALLGSAALISQPGLGQASLPALITPISEIQYTELPGGESPYAGEIVTIEGSVTAIFQHGFTLAEAAGAWQGIFVYTYTCGPRIGDRMRVTGLVAEYNGMTEIQALSLCEPVSGGQIIPPLLVPVSEAGQERYESVLLQVSGVQVTSLADYGEWEVSDGMGTLFVDDLNDYVYFPAPGDRLDRLTGILFYSYGAFKLEPRATTDFQGPPIPHYFLHGDLVTMKTDRNLREDAYLEIQGDRIITITQTAPLTGTIIHTNGLIFPGLVDAHNHPYYNTFGRLPFNTLFRDRYEWQADPLYQDFKEQYTGVRDYGGPGVLADDIFRLAELRALSSGTTTLQGCNCNGHEYDLIAHQGIGANNAERFPNRILSVTFPLRESSTYWQARQNEYWQRFVIHLSEGITPAALEEFYTWRDLGLLDPRTVIIHGIPYGSSEWAQMADAGAQLVWSPMSNWYLYGSTADIPAALEAGVNVALAPDWTETGMETLLTELKLARFIDHALWGDQIPPELLVEMITRRAAQALGLEAEAGQLASGYRADLLVIPGDITQPYQDFLATDPGQVLLTIASGRPMYGDPTLLAQFDFIPPGEPVEICAENRAFTVQVSSHAIPAAALPTSSTLAALATAYQATEPKIAPLLLLEDTTPPDLVLVPARYQPPAFPGGFVLRLGAFDGCRVSEVEILDLRLFDPYGQEINPSGLAEVQSTDIHFAATCTRLDVHLTASARDNSGNEVVRTLTYTLPACPLYLPFLNLQLIP